ncbi:hypothetical protein DdX_14276 [Ditylenchus destructor]|uniref:F-box domain-containing protein n=1 Tax=Ditylenchus destructor TaxID=166010 RepID=A0AAD4QYR9_9BILA|nr:hypothetical protein DdX_14276 [Ditylenchus destructor]
MLPTDVIMDILKCMNRDGLQKIQTSARVINDIITRDFPSKPLHFLDENIVLYIRNSANNVLLLEVCRPNQCFEPTISGWQNCEQRGNCVHSYPMDKMRPLSANYLRYRSVVIYIDEDDGITPYTPEHIASLEAISHIWSDQILSIIDCSDYNTESLKLMFKSSAILQCRTLRVFVSVSFVFSDFLQCSSLYNLHAIYFMWKVVADEIVSIIQHKAAFPMSDTILILCVQDELDMLYALDTVKEEFLTSSVPCRLRIIIEVIFIYHNSLTENLDFRLENSGTKEVLQLNHITKQEAKQKLDVVLYEYTNDCSPSIVDGVDGQASTNSHNVRMLPAYVLIDILKCMSRDALERIQGTTRTLNILIRSDFSLKPLRVVGNSYLGIYIKGGQLLLTIHRRKSCTDECLALSVRAGWQKCNMWHRCKHKYTLDQMHPFLAECVRFQRTKIIIDSHELYSSKAITELESIAHIWSEQHLAITDFVYTEENALCPLLSNSNMLRCRILDVYGDRTNFVENSRKYPALYALHAISYTWRILADEIVVLSRNKAKFPQSDCMFLFPGTHQDVMLDALEIIREVS